MFGLILGFVGASVGSAIGGAFWAQVGWFIGSTLGSYLDLEDTSSTTTGPRLTDFKTMNSKYGIAIPRGYGCVRHASNVIWVSGITETENRDTICVKIKGFLGTTFGQTKQCQTTVSFRYQQSAAFAFAEGPCDKISKVWADGKLIYDDTGAGDITIVEANSTGNPYSIFSQGPLRFYTGTLTQPIDSIILNDLGTTEAHAFRSIVYMIMDGIDLEQFGFRLPVITAEVCYSDSASTPVLTNFPLDVPLLGDKTAPSFDVLGYVARNTAYTVGGDSASTGNIAINDANTGRIIAEAEGVFDNGIPTGFITLSPELDFLRKVNLATAHFGPYNLTSKRQLYVHELLGASFVQLAYSTYNPATAELCATFTGGGAAKFTVGSTTTEVVLYGLTVPVLNGVTVKSYTNGGATTDTGREIFFAKNGDMFWLVDGAGGVWINRVKPSEGANNTTIAAPKFTRVQFNDATNVGSVANWTYNPADDSFILYVDVAGTSPVGLYKVLRSEIDAAGATLQLPLSTASGKYLNVTPSDQSAFQVGPSGNRLYLAKDANDLYEIDASSMTLIETYTSVPGGLGTIGTVPIPKINGIRTATDLITIRGGAVSSQTLGTVVSDLMTKSDGDDRARLEAADIDVTALTDVVRGYPLFNQQTVRAAITPLQQAYFFDVIESDGILKFVKRGQTNSFALVEDDLAAHEFGKTNQQTMIPVEYERQSEIELPREVAVNYTDIDLDYNQGTQRARRTQTDSDSNTSLTLPIVFNKDEAAQIADKLLNITWSERTAPFKFMTSIKHADIEPTDVGTVTMNDGTVYKVRIAQAKFGANNTLEIVAVNEYTSVYTSTAVGEDSLGDGSSQTIPFTGQLYTVVLDIPLGFLDDVISGQAGVAVGLGAYGSADDFNGGFVKVITSLGTSEAGASFGPSFSNLVNEGLTFGFTTNEVGHPNGPFSPNIFDYETSITVDILGGALPTSCTETEALAGGKDCLLILGREIIAFTNVSCTADVTVTGTDISFTAGTLSIDSTSTDFVAAGFTSGMSLIIEGSPANDATTYWEISSVTTNQIVLTNAPTTESAGASITITQAGGQCTFSGGLLRGLYGTEEFTYHEAGEQAVLATNLKFVPVTSTSSSGAIVTTRAIPTFGGQVTYGSTDYIGAAIKPWSPVDVTAAESGNNIVISWVRRDKEFGNGITSDSGVVGNSESIEEFQIDIRDAYTEGNEDGVLRTITGIAATNYTYTEADQVTDFGAIREEPILVDIYQMSQTIGRGFVERIVVDRDDVYAPIGETFANETAGVAYSVGTGRLNAGSNLIEASGDISANALRVATTVDTEYTAVSFDNASGVANIEVLTLVEMQTGTLSDLTAGVILRGQGASNADFSAMIVGLGGTSNNEFGIRHYTKGATATGLSASTTFSWSTGTVYAIRARYFDHRVQGKIWEYGDPEPGDWQVNFYDKNLGPEYGWIGPFAYHDTNDPLYHYFAWAHRGLKAA